jgi:hypothetical protein
MCINIPSALFQKKNPYPTKDHVRAFTFLPTRTCTLNVAYGYQWLEEVTLIAKDDDNAYVI